MRKFIAAAFACAALTGAAEAAPVTFIFQNPNADLPDAGNYTTGGSCNGISISGGDLCAVNQSLGLHYAKDWAGVKAVGGSAGDFALMQDLSPANSGLAVLTEGETNSDDQVQSARAESIEFTFDGIVELLAIDFNAGADRNCASPGNEGPCGTFDLIVDGVLVGDDLTAIDDMMFGAIVGKVFNIVATGPDHGGFAIGSITVAQVPVPGAAFLLLSGIAGMSFASRKKKRV